MDNWLQNLNSYKYHNTTYWIHKIKISNNWVLTTFVGDLTNIDLGTTNLKKAKNQALNILNNS